MSLLEAYLQQRRREQVRTWIAFAAANLVFVVMLLVMLYS